MIYVNAQFVDDTGLEGDRYIGEVFDDIQTQVEFVEDGIAAPQRQLKVLRLQFDILVQITQEPWCQIRFQFEHV